MTVMDVKHEAVDPDRLQDPSQMQDQSPSQRLRTSPAYDTSYQPSTPPPLRVGSIFGSQRSSPCASNADHLVSESRSLDPANGIGAGHDSKIHCSFPHPLPHPSTAYSSSSPIASYPALHHPHLPVNAPTPPAVNASKPQGLRMNSLTPMSAADGKAGGDEDTNNRSHGGVDNNNNNNND
eukprot:CAMPEP_0175064310 /NCGR_PEP_ID=MMETSP0052_2-20121109/15255_1 /TAXON_ID=51329 ORGANISM="Polytomella parva, Strain SAG 63-3" /NCGR_SAMPLE_ID=MMETSP0052_2 /ASSEMBLY_ACC=CAM_ASM_000194 /LENGTH=179 /DNA_ID=CAMNT_0016330633 /DNA_START=563 /DNA_END=1099 /DNA_ORIENTATION=+